mmetsp:Transcript_31187/g.70182  ORF Transcript_31187/g.70182 Transcript_31187/m.70182 type:complete len:214 (-) Transcript_31187:596-1237(-)
MACTLHRTLSRNFAHLLHQDRRTLPVHPSQRQQRLKFDSTSIPPCHRIIESAFLLRKPPHLASARTMKRHKIRATCTQKRLQCTLVCRVLVSMAAGELSLARVAAPSTWELLPRQKKQPRLGTELLCKKEARQLSPTSVCPTISTTMAPSSPMLPPVQMRERMKMARELDTRRSAGCITVGRTADGRRELLSTAKRSILELLQRQKRLPKRGI